jgi:hypothetical protein
MEGAGTGSHDRGTKRTREESNGTTDDSANIRVEVTTGEGVTVKLQLPPSSFVIVADCEYHRVQGFRLVVSAGDNSAHLEFVRLLENREGNDEGGRYYCTSGVALLGSNGGQQETQR